MPSQRSDSALVRWLTEQQGAQTAQAWQRVPLVRLPAQGFVDYIWDHQHDLQESMPEVDTLPWDDVILDFDRGRTALTRRLLQYMRDVTLVGDDPDKAVSVPLLDQAAAGAPDRGHCWARVCTLRRYLAGERVSSPWLSGPDDVLASFRSQPDQWLAIEVWEDNVSRPGGGNGFPYYPDVSLIYRALPWQHDRAAHLYPNVRCRSGRAYGAGFCHTSRCQFGKNDERRAVCLASDMVMQTGAILVLATLAYLLQSEEHLVEVTPQLTPAEQKQEARATDKKQWTRMGLPHYILLDPARARDYGSPKPAAEGLVETGKRTSPSAHGRRGHWSHLRAERFVHTDEDRQALESRGYVRRIWVRQAWIGPEMWIADGQRYRVVAPVSDKTGVT